MLLGNDLELILKWLNMFTDKILIIPETPADFDRSTVFNKCH